MPKYTEAQLNHAKKLKALGCDDGTVSYILQEDYKLNNGDIQAILKACAQDPALKVPRPVDIKDTTQYLYPYQYQPKIKNGKYTENYVKKPSFQSVPDQILNEGDPDKLISYFNQNSQKLNSDVRQFFKARIASAKNYSKAENQKLLALYKGEEAQLLPLVEGEQGFVGLNLKLNGPQTSYNGCWSTACSLMLKSRGVDLTQEDVRAFRPHPGEGEELTRHNADVGWGVEERADAILEALPNTALDALTLRPIFWSKLKWKGQPVTEMTKEQQSGVYNALFYAYRDTIANTIRNVLTKHRSPIALTFGGHTVTITGIYSDINTLRIEESLRGDASKEYRSTRFYSLDKLLKNFFCRTENNLVGTKDVNKYKSIQLSWIRSIDMPDESKRDTSIIKPYGEFSDSLTAVVNPSDNTVSYRDSYKPMGSVLDKFPQFGRVCVAFEKNLEGCQNLLSTDSDGGISVGCLASYLPNRLYYKRDSNLKKKFASQEEAAKRISVQKTVQKQPAQGLLVPENALKKEALKEEAPKKEDLKNAMPKDKRRTDPSQSKELTARSKLPENTVTQRPVHPKPEQRKEQMPIKKQMPIKSHVNEFAQALEKNKRPENAVPQQLKYRERLDPARLKKDNQFVVAYDKDGYIAYVQQGFVMPGRNGRFVVEEGAPMWAQSSGKLLRAKKEQFIVSQSGQRFFTDPREKDVLFAVNLRDIDQFFYRQSANGPRRPMMRLCAGRMEITKFCLDPKGRLIRRRGPADVSPNVERELADPSHPILRMLQTGKPANLPPKVQPSTAAQRGEYAMVQPRMAVRRYVKS